MRQISGTDLAEDLLEQATEIAWNAAGFGELSDDDINAIKALTKAPEARKQDLFSNKTDEGNTSPLMNPQSEQTPETTERNTMSLEGLDCFAVIFAHLGHKLGRIKRTIASSDDGVCRICCLTSKDHEAEKQMPNGERYWFTIYDRHLKDIQQAQQAYVAFVCGSDQQIILIPANTFSKWCSSLNPYTQGKTGWHVHLWKVAGNWELRRKEGEHPIDMTEFVI